MKRKRDQVIERLAATNPVVRPPDERLNLDERAETDLERMLSHPADTRGARGALPAAHGSLRRRRLVLATALAVVLAASGIATAAEFGLFDFREFPSPADVTGEPVRTGPRAVIATGRTSDLSWRFVGFESTRGLCFGLEIAGKASAASTSCGAPTLDDGIGFPTADYIGSDAGRTWFYGPVSRDATRVVLTLADGRRLTAAILPSPRRFSLAYDFYLASVGGAVPPDDRGDPPVRAVVAYDEAGSMIAEKGP